MWVYNETEEFIRSKNSLRLSNKVLTALQDWSQTVGRVQTNRTKLFFRSPSNIFEIWTGRVPDPDNNKGCSGGFRLVYFFKLTENAVYLDKIEHRSSVGGKNEHPKEQQKFTNYLNNLKESLCDVWDSD